MRARRTPPFFFSSFFCGNGRRLFFKGSYSEAGTRLADGQSKCLMVSSLQTRLWLKSGLDGLVLDRNVMHGKCVSVCMRLFARVHVGRVCIIVYKSI